MKTIAKFEIEIVEDRGIISVIQRKWENGKGGAGKKIPVGRTLENRKALITHK